MPYRIFMVPVLHGDDAVGELNAFIASHRIAHIERRWIDQGSQSAWAFCIEYILAVPSRDLLPRSTLGRNRIDYKTILTSDEFTRFSLLREMRKELSQQEGIPVFALFSNEQLAQMVQRRCGSKADLLSIEGIGDAKVEKYSERVLAVLAKLGPSNVSSELS